MVLSSLILFFFVFFFSSRRRHTRWPRDWSSDVCSSDLGEHVGIGLQAGEPVLRAIAEPTAGLSRGLDDVGRMPGGRGLQSGSRGLEPPPRVRIVKIGRAHV